MCKTGVLGRQVAQMRAEVSKGAVRRRLEVDRAYLAFLLYPTVVPPASLRRKARRGRVLDGPTDEQRFREDAPSTQGHEEVQRAQTPSKPRPPRARL